MWILTQLDNLISLLSLAMAFALAGLLLNEPLFDFIPETALLWIVVFCLFYLGVNTFYIKMKHKAIKSII